MKADFLILCGGLGTRLRSVTGDSPKVMADVQGEPFLDFLLRYLIKQGARRVILCAGYKAEALEKHYQEKFREIEICLSIEKEPLGTGGAFKNAQSLIRNDHVFGLNGDCFTPVNYQKLFSFHKEKKALGTLVAVKIEGNKDFGTIVTNDRDEVVAFKEKFETKEVQFISAGIYCFHKSIFDMMPADKFSIEYHLFPKMIGDRFYGFKVDAPFIDIGTPERFAWAKEHLAEMIE
jgi:D-glycero-alpha-D-manno-heptose 1-phosphate guanylyltransferase